jgi:glycosyltransferase involved in cell wall biosynthesis
MTRHPRTALYVANASKIGGGNGVFMDLMLNLDPSRYVPVLVAPEPGPLVDWADSRHIRCVISPAGDWGGAAGLARRSVQLARLIRQFRAAVVHAAAPMAYRALGIAAIPAGAARVCHLGFPPEFGELERSFVCGPDAVIGCYDGQAEEHQDRIRAITPQCLVIGVPNGVDTNRFAPGFPSPEAAALREDASLVVAILGHISDVKGYPTFVEAAARIASNRPDCLFIAIGGETTQPGCRTALERRIRGLGLETRFRFLGFRTDVAEILRAVDVVALPSSAEGFPLAVLEAMSTGLPVVATPVGGVPEVLSDGETGLLVPPGDVDALTLALSQLVSSPERRARLGAAARKRIEERYAIDVFARAVQNVYDTILTARNRLTTRIPAAARRADAPRQAGPHRTLSEHERGRKSRRSAGAHSV